MATVTGLTAARMQEIEDASVVDGEVVSGNLMLTKHDGSQINAGPVIGPPGPVGPSGTGIPGEIKLWPGLALPVEASYGLWTWANGGVFNVADYPLAAAHIDPLWKTAYGQSDPGAGKFRVPDMRGLVPAGLDQMPVGRETIPVNARANRVTRAVAITIATKTGEETHVVIVPEMPSHSHRADGAGGTGGTTAAADRSLDHLHNAVTNGVFYGPAGNNWQPIATSPIGATIMGWAQTGGADRSIDHLHGISANGGGGAHETMQPTVFVPYIVKLDD